MTQEKLKELQKEISKHLLEVATAEHCLNRDEKLITLNMRLDSLNRAAYYMRDEQDE